MIASDARALAEAAFAVLSDTGGWMARLHRALSNDVSCEPRRVESMQLEAIRLRPELQYVYVRTLLHSSELSTKVPLSANTALEPLLQASPALKVTVIGETALNS